MCTDNFAQTGSKQRLTLTRTTVNYYESFQISHFVALNKTEYLKVKTEQKHSLRANVICEKTEI